MQQDIKTATGTQDSVQVRRLKKMLGLAVTPAQRKQVEGMIRDQQRSEARAARLEAQMTAQRRRHRAKNLRECGELVELAGLLDTDRSLLLGALRFVARNVEEGGELMHEWTLDGRQMLDAQAKEKKKETKRVAVNDNAPDTETQTGSRPGLLRGHSG